MDWYELPSYSTGKGPFHAAVIASGVFIFDASASRLCGHSILRCGTRQSPRAVSDNDHTAPNGKR
ncbi:MAG: hypothetical protein WB347_06210, partial [Terriglobales bacterium]